MFQTSRNGLGPAEKLLADHAGELDAGHVVVAQVLDAQQAGLEHDDVGLVGLAAHVAFALGQLRADLAGMPSVIIERSVAMSDWSQASCSVTKLRLAAARKPWNQSPRECPRTASPPAPSRSARRPHSRGARARTCRRKRHAVALPRAGRRIVAHVVRAVLARAVASAAEPGALEGVGPAPAADAPGHGGAHDHANHHHDHQREQPEQHELAKSLTQPSELASQASPGRRPDRPAWHPRGAWARRQAGAGAAAWPAAALVAFCAGAAGAAGAASRCVTLLD
jgi:hypothetical protein